MDEKRTRKKPSLFKTVLKQKNLYLMILPALVCTFVFVYMPIWGIATAFFDYNPGIGFTQESFVGFKHFERFFSDPNFFGIMRNTLAISVLNIVFGTISAIFFAIMLNELMGRKFKKTVQTVSYLPHFISFVVVANIAHTLLATKGIINTLLLALGIVDKPIVFFAIPEGFWPLVTIINIWKETGWSAIIYIAAIAGIDPALYEAAMIDGASKVKRIWHITLTGIQPTIVVLLIMAVPDLLSAGFDASYLLGNAMVSEFSEVLDTYVFRVGLREAQYSYATAIGLMRQVIGLILILAANTFAKRVSEYSLF